MNPLNPLLGMRVMPDSSVACMSLIPSEPVAVVPYVATRRELAHLLAHLRSGEPIRLPMFPDLLAVPSGYEVKLELTRFVILLISVDHFVKEVL